MRLLLLLGVLSLSPPLDVAIHMSPPGAGSTVRSRPNVPWKNVWAPVTFSPLRVSRTRRVPRWQATYRALLMMVMPLHDPSRTG
jgi:hypothetical protein